MPEEAEQFEPTLGGIKDDNNALKEFDSQKVSDARSKAKIEFTDIKKTIFEAVAEDAKKSVAQIKEDARMGKTINDVEKIKSLALGKKIDNKKVEFNYEDAKEMSKEGDIKELPIKGDEDIKRVISEKTEE